MFRQLKIASKLILPTLTLVTLGVVLILLFIQQQFQTSVIQHTQQYLEAITYQYATFVKAELETPLSEVRAIARLVEITANPTEVVVTRQVLNTQLKNYIEKNPTIFAVYLIFEPNAFDGLDSTYKNTEQYDTTGRFAPYWTRTQMGVGTVEFAKNRLLDAYQTLKSTEQEEILSPYLTTVKNQDVSLISFLVPLFDKQKRFIGVAGADLLVSSLNYIATVHLTDATDTLLEVYAEDGTIAISHDKTHIGQPANALYYDEQILTGISKAQSFFSQRTLGQHTFLTYGMPFRIGFSNTSWLITIDIPESRLMATEHYVTRSIIALGVTIIIGTMLILIPLTRRLTKPLQQLNIYLQHLAQGQLNQKQDYQYTSQDEISELLDATRRLQTGLYRIIQQTNAIAIGDYHRQIELLSDNDQLGLALSNMTAMLHQANEKNRLQDWLKTGQTRLNECMSGEQDKYMLAKKVIVFLTRYLEMQVGTLYGVIPAKQPTTLKLLASYAYNQRKTIANEFILGEGIIGQVALECRPIIMTDIPEDYMIIRSGLGNTTPRVLLVFPILYENELKGIVELGTFKILNNDHVEFLKQVIPSIGIALNTTDTNQKMRDLSKI
ncbi:GAF domain-containing protein [Beggiatoa leptomitoformis]|uniref:GAF domain-containing protein n=1 Tax=Beggiatoa leptomitoformis TaxID=288004 RepID=A0A2N9YCD9_9GAMM|nr:GAF domain-containing protein [Beggiatoa leptomitoformis]ALG66582.1 GAF domain-containing protein [Beggiatoa leptomitoformis]AUI68112.1 GAF domain-containing protein [Beggiatoa leptomitoformis]